MLISRSPTSTRDANLFGDSSGVRWLRPCGALGGLPQEYGSRDLLCNPELPCRSRFFQLRMDAFWHRNIFCSMTPWLRSLWISCCLGFFEPHAAFTFSSSCVYECCWLRCTHYLRDSVSQTVGSFSWLGASWSRYSTDANELVTQLVLAVSAFICLLVAMGPQMILQHSDFHKGFGWRFHFGRVLSRMSW